MMITVLSLVLCLFLPAATTSPVDQAWSAYLTEVQANATNGLQAPFSATFDLRYPRLHFIRNHMLRHPLLSLTSQRNHMLRHSTGDTHHITCDTHMMRRLRHLRHVLRCDTCCQHTHTHVLTRIAHLHFTKHAATLAMLVAQLHTSDITATLATLVTQLRRLRHL